MKQKVTIIYDRSVGEVQEELKEIIANGGEIIQLVHCGIGINEPHWIVIYKQ